MWLTTSLAERTVTLRATFERNVTLRATSLAYLPHLHFTPHPVERLPIIFSAISSKEGTPVFHQPEEEQRIRQMQ
ncbi:hypothetical protein BST61_g1395 [Cercospora zeina]